MVAAAVAIFGVAAVAVGAGVPPDSAWSTLALKVGHEPAWWEVLAYVPGDWEEELSRPLGGGSAGEHEREKGQFGIE
ncbi:MAG TPA: hypothetical protein VKM72_31150 [Thermoanaerobaculia bacterium]|nr:hypothetical protein [Thermoanaerobaculia bacterium]